MHHRWLLPLICTSLHKPRRNKETLFRFPPFHLSNLAILQAIEPALYVYLSAGKIIPVSVTAKHR